MYCGKCGAAVTETQPFCAKCGQPVAAAVAEAAEQRKFERAIRRLSRYWYLFAGLSIVLGAMGLFAIQTGLSMHAGPWEPWPHPYIWNWTLTGSTAWTLLGLRILSACAAGWGLARHTDWSRPVALLAAVVAFTEFPIGFALAVYTFSVLLGKRHSELYARIGKQESTMVIG